MILVVAAILAIGSAQYIAPPKFDQRILSPEAPNTLNLATMPLLAMLPTP